MHREFPSNADMLEGDDRRHFIKIMGASFALAGMGLAACRRIPETNIVPYANRPADRIPGKPIEYASAMELAGVGTGVLVRTVDGRPIKLEGNPSHPASLGACNASTQANVLEVYDPHRARFVMHGEHQRDAAAFGELVNETFLKTYAANGGEGLAILAEASSSPSRAAMRATFEAAFPKATWTDWEPITGDNEREGTRVAFGAPRRVEPSLVKAQCIVCLGADPLGEHSASTRLAREWADNRRIDAADSASQELSRMYVMEGGLSITGMMADERIAMRPSDIGSVAVAIAAHLGILPSGSAKVSSEEAVVVKAMLKDLDAHHGESILMAGEGQASYVHALVAAINEKLGNVGSTVTYVTDNTPNRMEAMSALTSSMSNGSVKALVVIGGNPVYDAPADLNFAAALAKVDLSIHLSLYRNETSHGCSWSLPRSHWLEAWGDVSAFDGTKSITQPTIMPMIPEAQRGWSPIELLAELCGTEPRDGYSIVRATEMARSKTSGATFESHWRKVLDRGIVADTNVAAVASSVDSAGVAKAAGSHPAAADGLELLMHADLAMVDGRYANLGWLQELPHAITKITWDNAACMSPALMEEFGLEIGDMVLLNTGSGSLKAAAFPVPGMNASTVSLTLGWGRGAEAGPIANGAGFNAYALRTTMAPDIVSISLANTGEHYDFAHTQDHGALDALIPDVPLGNSSGGVQGRLPTIVRETTLENYKHHPDFASHAVHVAHRLSLWEETNLDGGRFRWALSVDLNTCTGCGACVTACQAENNIPIVGKDQIARGRELHWIRIDRYFKGDDTAKPEGVFVQPVMCMQCENAPCEQVCPVAATLHDKDGLNVMVYNRCIGTRYCSNNCPYKVRRFNWFDYWRREPVREQDGIFAVKPDYYTSGGPDEWRRMQLNPEVTVRTRGVMEKCSFCVQRITTTRIELKNEWARKGGTAFSPDWSLPDGAIQTACQQACSTNAIVFGDLADSSSAVSKLQKQKIAYGLLEELNTKPRVKYLAKVRNPSVSTGSDNHDHEHGHENDSHAAKPAEVNIEGARA